MRILLLIIYFFVAKSYAQTLDTLHWNVNRKLKWADFQGVQNDSVNEAVSTCSISYHYCCDTDIYYKFIICNVFYKKKSWVKNGCQNADNLNHEQTHFNISEYYSRKLRNELRTHKFTSKDEILINVIYDNIIYELKQTQKKYDIETTHLKFDKVTQKKWDKKVTKLIETYPAD